MVRFPRRRAMRTILDNMTPEELSNELLELSNTYGTHSDELGEILEGKARLWMKIREKTKSDTSAERTWNATDMGIREVTLKLKLKAIEKRMSALRTRLRIMDTEAKNMF